MPILVSIRNWLLFTSITHRICPSLKNSKTGFVIGAIIRIIWIIALVVKSDYIWNIECDSKYGCYQYKNIMMSFEPYKDYLKFIGLWLIEAINCICQESKIYELENEIKNIKEDIDANREDIDAHDQKLIIHDEDIGSVKEEIKTHDQILIIHDEDIVSHTKDINNNKVRISANAQRLIYHGESIVANDQRLNNHDYRITILEPTPDIYLTAEDLMHEHID